MMAARTLSPGILLGILLKDLVKESCQSNIHVTGLTTDSRKVNPGDLFIAYTIEGQSSVPYIGVAVNAGASAVIAEACSLPEIYPCPVPLFRVNELYKIIGIIADRYYDHPSTAMSVIGVTGTNGKTSVSHLMAQSLSVDQKNVCGLIGTLGYGTIDRLIPGPHTTPEAVALQALLADMRDQNIKQVVMEVSSHGLDQFRIAGVAFDLAVFTNLSRDHLDYHQSMESYAAAKKRLFTQYGVSMVVINLDDEFGRKLMDELPKNILMTGYTIGENIYSEYKDKFKLVYGKIIPDPFGNIKMALDTPWGKGVLTTGLTGRFNAGNLLACLASLCLLGHTLEDAIRRLSICKGIPGRMETFGGENFPRIIVDYAHTPDALEQVLSELRHSCQGKLYCVFGCGGDRDKGKRPLMAALAEKYADGIIITSDNPRHEDPAEIANDILAGIKNRAHVIVDIDRERAIQNILKTVSANDVVLIAGKGHENYQEIAGVRRFFSDQDVVRKTLGILA
jgi:UDP-N-acetylmuramoyl-L-alanyl-D-glutamate--2,6-diaminopimelate ligase